MVAFALLPFIVGFIADFTSASKPIVKISYDLGLADSNFNSIEFKDATFMLPKKPSSFLDFIKQSPVHSKWLDRKDYVLILRHLESLITLMRDEYWRFCFHDREKHPSMPDHMFNQLLNEKIDRLISMIHHEDDLIKWTLLHQIKQFLWPDIHVLTPNTSVYITSIVRGDTKRWLVGVKEKIQNVLGRLMVRGRMCILFDKSTCLMMFEMLLQAKQSRSVWSLLDQNCQIIFASGSNGKQITRTRPSEIASLL